MWLLDVSFGVAGAVLALAAVACVWRMAQRQSRLMSDQGVIIQSQLKTMQDQAAILARMEKLEQSQERNVVRQAEVAESQRRVVKEQLGRRADLSFRLSLSVNGNRLSWKLLIRNTGDRTASECAWQIFTPEDLAQMVRVQNSDGAYVHVGEGRPDIRGEVYRPHCGELKQSIYPNSEVHAATIVIHPQVVSNPRVFFPISVKYVLLSEDGQFPPYGYLDLTLDDPGIEWTSRQTDRHLPSSVQLHDLG